MTTTNIRTHRVRHRGITLCVFALLVSLSVHASAEKRRVVYLGTEGGPGVAAEVRRTLDDAVRAQVGRAAHDRGFTEVYLRRVPGLEEEAATCRERACRLSIAKRLGVTHTLRGRVARVRKGYEVQLYLEDAATGGFLYGVSARGDVPSVRGGLIDETTALFEKAAPKDTVARDRLAKTARAYLAKERPADAAQTFLRAVDVSPFHPDAPVLALAALRALDKAGETEDAWKQTEVVLDAYGPGSAWALAGIGDADAVHAALRERLLALGAADHKLADNDDEARARAVRTWQAYLAHFPDADDVATVEVYLADLRFAAGEYVDAAASYESALEGELPEELKEIAATSTVLAYEKAMTDAMKRGDTEPVDLDGETTFAPEAKELSSLEERWVAAADRVAQDFPQADDAARFAYRAATLYALRGHTGEARRRFAAVAQAFPRTRPGRLAKKLAAGR